MKCLDSLRPPYTEFELVLVANGQKLSQEIIQFAEALTPHFKLIETETQLSPGMARNMAIRESGGEWIYFLDDDAFVLKSYWDVLLPQLQDTKIDVLGGPDSPAVGMNSLSTALAIALSSPFCTGTTFYRHKSYGTKLQYADEEKLTSCNLWVRRTALGDVTFPEDFRRAEENLFLQRLKKNGAGMFYHPRLKVAHFRRSHFKLLLRPTFYAGFYRSRLMSEKVVKNNKVFWLPAVFVLLHLLIFIDPLTVLYLARMYVSIILFVSLSLCMRERRASLFLLVAFLHYFVVFLYGVGFLYEKYARARGKS
jgi:glycosyltransferase involved in cell wall biosynthesis